MGAIPPPHSCCTLYLAMLLACPKGPTLTSPDREWPAAAGHRRDIFAAYFICPQEIVLRPPNRRIYILPHVHAFWRASSSRGRYRLTM